MLIQDYITNLQAKRSRCLIQPKKKRVASFFLLIPIKFKVCLIDVVVIKCEVQEIKQDNKDEAGQAHRDGTKDPQKQRKEEVEGTQS